MRPVQLLLAVVLCSGGACGPSEPELPPEVEAQLAAEEEALERGETDEPAADESHVTLTVRARVEGGASTADAVVTWATVPRIGEPLRTRVEHGSVDWGTVREQRLRVPADHALVEISVGGEGIAPRRRVWILDEALTATVERDGIEIAITPMTTVDGVVRGPDGEPLGGANVYLIGTDLRALLQFPSGSVATALGEIEARSVTADESGRFVVDRLIPGSHYTVVAEAPGGLRTNAVDWVAGEEAPELVLLRPARLDLLVRSESGELETAHVRIDRRLFPPRVAEIGAVADDGARTFTFPALPPQAHRITIEAPDHLRQVAEAELSPGEQRTLELELRSGNVVAGTITDGKGDPVRFARVVLTDTAGGDLVHKGKSDVDGRYELAGVADGEYELRVEPAAHAWTTRVVAVEGDTTEDVVAPGFGGVRVDVVPREGQATPDRIFVAPVLPDGSLGRGRSKLWSRSGVLVDDLPSGEQVLAILAAGAPRQLVSATIRAGAVTDLGQVRLTEGRGVDARLLDSAGRPVAGAIVRYGARLTPEEQELVTDADGRFRLEALPDEGVDLRIAPSSGPEVAVPLDGGLTSAELELPPSGRVQFLLRNRFDREPRFDVTLVIRTQGDESPHETELLTDAFGAAEVHLPPGRYELREGDDPAPALDFEVEAGRTHRFVLPSE